MVPMIRFGLVVATLLAASTVSPYAGAPTSAPVSVQAIKYNDLAKQIRSLKGKVIVVDFWADFCPPCKKEFPHLVELHNKYAADGLVAVSVSLDDPADQKVRQKVLEFLEKRKAEFTNLILDEPSEFWQMKLKIDGPPCVYVYNRDNKIAKKLPAGENEPVDYQVIEKLVMELLKK
jgi:thiol-disulfide isomerase/thioredoxin